MSKFSQWLKGLVTKNSGEAAKISNASKPAGAACCGPSCCK